MITFHPTFLSESRNKFSFRYGTFCSQYKCWMKFSSHNFVIKHATSMPDFVIIQRTRSSLNDYKNNRFKIHDIYKDIPNLLKYLWYPKKKSLSYQAYWLLQSLPDQSVQLFACLHNWGTYPNHEMSPPLQHPYLDLYHSYNKMQNENTGTCCHLNFIMYFQNSSY